MPQEYIDLIGKKFMSIDGKLLFIVNGISIFLGQWVVGTGFEFHIHVEELLNPKRFKELI